MNITRRAAAVAATVLVSGACASDVGSSSNDPGVKTGGDAEPLTITIADSQDSSKPSPAALQEFESLVESESAGAIEVEVVLEFGSDDAVSEAVIGGDVQMAMVPARAWSNAGVDSMRPLQAPFVVQSEAHLDAIVTDATIVSQLFAGLDEAGVHGVTMLPESLRHLFSFTTPILTPDDVAGRQVRHQPSEEVAAIIAALGATPVDPGDTYRELVADGTITAADSSFSIAISANPTVATGTANLTFYPKVVTFVANAGFWDALTDGQRTLLTDAAQSMQDWSIGNRVAEAEAAEQYCADGGTVVLTDPESVAAFRDAVTPIYDELTQDPEAAATIEAIEALAPETLEQAVEPCSPPGAAMSYDQIVPNGGELPNGVYRIELTDDFLAAHGLAGDEQEIANNNGVWTFRLEDGHASTSRVTSGGDTYSWEQIYQVDGEVMYWKLPHLVGGFVTLRWSVDSDGTLHFTEVEPSNWSKEFGVPDPLFDLPWVRVGDL